MKKLAVKIVKLLIKKKLKISVAESCTGGLLSSAITSVKGSSKAFSLGLVVYSNRSKNDILKIPKNVIKKYGAVSAQVCLSMAKNVKKIAKTNISVSITGIAGPGGGSTKKPVGLVYAGITKGNSIKIQRFLFKNKGRLYIQKAALNKSLRLVLAIVK